MLSKAFSTQDAPEIQRTRFFENELNTLFSVSLAVKPTSPQPFMSEMLAFRSRRLHLASFCFSPHRTSFAGISRIREPRLLVSLHKEGEVEISQGGRDARVNPGDIFMIDPSRPFTIQTGAIRTYSIYLQPASMRQLVPQLDGLTARPIPGYGGAGAIFRALLDEVFQLAPALNEAMADRIADAVPYVLATALGSLPEARDVLPTQLKLFHKQRIRSFAREHLDDPQLDPEKIAHAVNLSERYIHQLFSDEPLTLMKWIWSERLDRCAKELAEPALQNRSIGEIAYSWGFSDLAHFSRAFRERFGRAPRQFRQDAEQATGRQN